jgi:sulfite reductase alpha subunit-like flavoprotein
MRALLQERSYLKKNIHGGTCGKNILFFGCKNESIDFIYREELESFEKDEVLHHFYKAFSRDSNTKEYVQHIMAKPDISIQLMQWIDEGAYVYVCGATAMGADVMTTMQSIVQKHKNINPMKAVAYVKELQEYGRYIQELWTA